MQMQTVDTKAGTPISPAPTMMASFNSVPRCRWRSMFSIVTMAWSTSTPTERARPPSVIRFSVSPSTCRMITEVRIDSGIVSAITSVLRQLPRNSNTSAAVRPAAIRASITTPTTAALTKTDWSNSVLTVISLGMTSDALGSSARRLDMMSSVDAPPFLSTDSSTPRWPS